MADSTYRAQVTIPIATGLPEDAVMNTWHFMADTANSDAAITTGIVNALTNFYQQVDGVIFSAQVGTPAVVEVFDISDATPRVPIGTGSIALIPAASGLLPHEVAICLSYQGPRQSGIPQARHRGRIFLGPLTPATGAVLNGEFRVISTTRSTIGAAADSLANATALTTGTLRWCVFSPTTYESTGDTAFSSAIVTDGWVDDAYDIQRRRGAAATTRTLW